ncbi:M55 family metallopeptidase [Streptomyces sp. NPDC045470]|uniref:M55 family metallopeptidase n=1 Tax=Streptomyces sp. NPDC045470 TaxID=3155469 RepID=UPI0033DFC1B0
MGHGIEDIRLDGRPVGETGLAQATAAALGVPVVALTGDDGACAEMREWDDRVATVAVAVRLGGGRLARHTGGDLGRQPDRPGSRAAHRPVPALRCVDAGRGCTDRPGAVLPIRTAEPCPCPSAALPPSRTADQHAPGGLTAHRPAPGSRGGA